MKYKLVLAVVLILAIVGIVYISDAGQPVGEFFSGQLGGVTSYFTGGSKGPAFGVNLKVNTEALYGSGFKISNSSIRLSGVPSAVSLNGQTLSMKESQVVKIDIENFKGTVSLNKDGSVGIVGETNYVEIDNLVFSSDKPKKLEVNAGSNDLSIDSFSTDKISLASASGTVDRVVNGLVDSASFDGKVEMNNFVGSMRLAERTAEFLGTATSVKGDKFSFN